VATTTKMPDHAVAASVDCLIGMDRDRLTRLLSHHHPTLPGAPERRHCAPRSTSGQTRDLRLHRLHQGRLGALISASDALKSGSAKSSWSAPETAAWASPRLFEESMGRRRTLLLGDSGVNSHHRGTIR